MSLAVTQARPEEKADNEWTILIFFAGEENISPAMTSQLKAIKDAGFEKRTSVLIHYDPNKRGVGTVTFDINRLRKAEMGTSIGDGRDPFVRNLIEDIIPGAPKGATAEEALKMFLRMGVKQYRAKHYAVVLVGHGMVVGNDAFLPDNSPDDTAITLKQLGKILQDFKRAVDFEDNGGVVELIGLHSCSMSAIEVLYELKGAARYLMATEGISFVGSWPYRQLMKKILHTIDEGKDKNALDVKRLIMSVQRLALHNSTDFIFSGISADLCLSSLNPEKVDELNKPLRDLTKALKDGLKTARGLELIKLAHLEAQSYWHETYSDLFDFCLCLGRECNLSDPVQKSMADACKQVRDTLRETNHPDGLIVRSDYVGPLFQYSHGLSIYFPWAPPVQDVPALPGDDILQRYADYNFTREFKTCSVDESWLDFLNQYFKQTRRSSRMKEDNPNIEANGSKFFPAHVIAMMGSASNGVESLDDDPRKPTPQLQKPSPQLFDGGCDCTIKNYPMEFMGSVRAYEDPNAKSNGSPSPQPVTATVTR